MELVSIMERWTVCAKSVVTLICMGTPACIVCDTVMKKGCVHHGKRSVGTDGCIKDRCINHDVWCYNAKDSPHPHVLVALGWVSTKCDSIISFL